MLFPVSMTTIQMNYENSSFHTKAFLHVMNLHKKYWVPTSLCLNYSNKLLKCQSFFKLLCCQCHGNDAWEKLTTYQKTTTSRSHTTNCFFQTIQNSDGAHLDRTCAYFEGPGSQTKPVRSIVDVNYWCIQLLYFCALIYHALQNVNIRCNHNIE